MKYMNKRKLITNTLWAALIIGIAAYAFAPTIRNHVGTVKPSQDRAAKLDLDLSTLDGGRWSLNDNRGKVVLVNFWATWCPPCRMETPGLVAAHRKFAGRGFTVVGITLDEDPAKEVPPFVQRYSIPYPILLPSGQVADQISSLPTSVLLDGDGRVARTYVGMVSESRLEADVDTLLRERGDDTRDNAILRHGGPWHGGARGTHYIAHQ